MDLRHHPLWTALVTPLNTDLSPDLLSLSGLIREQQQANSGLLVLGSTGESLNLSLETRKRILEHCLSLSPQLPLMVGVPGHDLAATLSWLRYLETLPIDAYLMITPIYARPSDEGQYHWFNTLMDHVTRPVMLYNVPKRTGASLSLAAVKRLHQHKNYWAIKDASGSVAQFSEYLNASSNKPVFCGDDQLFPDFAKAGSTGLISVASNVWPLGVKHYVEQCLNRSFTDHALWNEACEKLFFATNPISVKRVLFEEKRIACKTMMPPLSDLDFADCTDLCGVSERIKTWTRQYI